MRVLGPFLVIAMLLGAAEPARAHATSVRLLSDDLGGGDAAPARLWTRELAFSAGAAAVAVPVAFFGARALGRVPRDIVLAAAPSMLLFLALPAASAALAGWWSVRDVPGRRWWPSLLLAGGTQFATLVTGVLLGVSATSPLGLVSYFVVDVALLAGVSTLGLELFPDAAPAPIAALRPVERVTGERAPPAMTLLAFGF